MAGSGFSSLTSPETTMSRKRAKKARSFSWKGGQKSAEKLVIAKSGTPRASSASTIAWTPGTGPVIVSPKRSLQAAISAAYCGEFLAELGRGLGIGPAAVERLVPAVEVDILDEAQPRLVVGDLPDEEGSGSQP